MAQERSLLMAFAVADRWGALIACERMDGTPSRNLTHAIRKAFTSGEMGRDTTLFADQLRERSGDLVQWGNPMLTTLAGGCVVQKDGEVLGAVACGGAARRDRYRDREGDGGRSGRMTTPRSCLHLPFA